MNPVRLFYLCLFSMSAMIGCSEEMPVNIDGNANLTLQVMWDSSGTLFQLSNAKVIIVSDYGTMVRYTNESGIINLAGLPSALYNIAVRKPYPLDNTIIIVGSLLNLELESGQGTSDTIIAKPASGSGLSINEIYYPGPVNNTHYMYDQFIEIYNSSDSLKYLDGIMVMRVSGNNSDGGKGPGADQDDDNDIDGAIYVFRFPGFPGGKEHPINPKTVIVLASDAYNHKRQIASSLDLRNADWEFFNQFSPIDNDNTSVPNLRNMVTNEESDFMINLTNDVIIISNGMDSVWTDGIDINTIIDGIEYQDNSRSRKTLDYRVDRSIVVGPPWYSGKSIQRREPGVDTNNGMLDWEILSTPTPGF